ncbi:(2,3-dihydroxybenzoyl)adenylate synthase [Dactylosporangium sp. CA-233914]|uniref:(2,3-dihydroxybenzoyl)adenylate synthase n=1 Tax=Dactylosporangium sp. CA-233914 TaxID=3239934 RepID=UPI003D8F0712
MTDLTPWPADLQQRYLREGYWGAETLDELFRGWAARFGPRTAVVAGQRRLTYAELDAAADRTAGGLRALGVAAGDRAVVQLPNTADVVIVLLGMLRAGIVPVLALPAHRRSEIEHLVRLSEAVVYVGPDLHEGFDHRVLAAEVADACPTLRHVVVAGDPGRFTALRDLPDGEPVGGRADPAGIAVLLVSGGTTGRPKLIPRTHRDYAYNAFASAEVCGLSAEDVYLVCLPAGHNFPLACPGLLGTFSVGGKVVLAPAGSPDVAFGLIEAERVTVTALVPPLARFWLEAAEWDGRDRSSLRLLQVGGARLDAETAARVRPELGCALQQVFGMAEGLLNYTRLDDPEELVLTTQGLPLSPADEIRVIGKDGVEVPPGEVGELWTRGPYTLRGYYRAPEHNRIVFAEGGWFRTGDLVRALPTGHLVVEGRVKDVINRGGENVSATDLEEHLLAHPAVAQAAVVGLPDPALGEIACAVVTLVPGSERAPKLKEIKAFLAEQGLARFMHPDRLVVIDVLPVTAVGKINKREIVARVTMP